MGPIRIHCYAPSCPLHCLILVCRIQSKSDCKAISQDRPLCHVLLGPGLPRPQGSNFLPPTPLFLVFYFGMLRVKAQLLARTSPWLPTRKEASGKSANSARVDIWDAKAGQWLSHADALSVPRKKAAAATAGGKAIFGAGFSIETHGPVAAFDM